MCLLILANQIEDDLGLEVSNFTIARVGRTNNTPTIDRGLSESLSVSESDYKILLQHEIYTIMNEGSKDVEKKFRKIEQLGIHRHILDYRSPGVLTSFIAVFWS